MQPQEAAERIRNRYLAAVLGWRPAKRRLKDRRHHDRRGRKARAAHRENDRMREQDGNDARGDWILEENDVDISNDE